MEGIHSINGIGGKKMTDQLMKLPQIIGKILITLIEDISGDINLI